MKHYTRDWLAEEMLPCRMVATSRVVKTGRLISPIALITENFFIDLSCYFSRPSTDSLISYQVPGES